MKIKNVLFFLLCISFLSFVDQRVDPDEDLRGLSQVTKLNGLHIYMLSEPLAEYEVVMDLTSSTGVLASIIGENIALDDIARVFTDKAKRKNKKARKKGDTEIEAVIIYSKEKAAGIRYVVEEEEEGE